MGFAYLGLVIEQSRPCNLLLVTAAECLAPLSGGIPATFTLDDAVHVDEG